MAGAYNGAPRGDTETEEVGSGDRWGVRFELLLVLVLAACLALVLRGVLGGGVLFYSDLGQQLEPLRHTVADALASGQALWTPRLSNGAPLLGNPMTGVGYPPSLAASLLASRLEPSRVLTLLAIAHLALGAAGTWLAAAALGLGRPARWAAAAVVTLAGTTLSATAFPTLQWGLAWLPWVVVAGRRLARDPRGPIPVLGLAAVLAMAVLVGEPTGVLAALLGLAMLELRPGADALVRLPKLVTAGAVAALLAAPVVLPTVRLAAGSVRAAGFTPEGTLLWSLHPLHALELVMPGIFGDPRGFGLEAFWARELVAPREHPLLLGMYLGLATAVLALMGLGRPHRDRWPLAAWLAVLIALALGRFGPLGAWLVGLPGGDALRFPVKWLVPAVVPLALLAALGVETLARRERTAARRLLVASLAVVVLMVAVAGLTMAGLDGAIWTSAVETGPGPGEVPPGAPSVARVQRDLVGGAGRAGVPVALLAVLAAAALRPRASFERGHRPAAAAWLAWAVAAVLAADLAGANRALLPTVPESAYRALPPPLEIVASDPGGHRRIWADTETPRFASNPSSPADAFRRGRASLSSYAAVAFGFDLALNVDIEALTPLASATFKALTDSAPDRERLMLLGAAGVSHLVTPRTFGHPLARPIGTCAPEGVVPIHVYRNLAEVPRARVVPALTPFRGSDGFIAAVRSGPDDLFSGTALVETSTLVDLPSPPAGGAANGTCRIVEDEGSRLVIRTAGGGGYLIVSDTLTTGWTARVDGYGAQLFRADLAFRGVPVPPGVHTIVMTDRPWLGPAPPLLRMVAAGGGR